MKTIVIGSRGSALALWQANFVKSELENLGCTVQLKIIKTKGDAIQNLSLNKLEGKGFFTKEIEEALLNEQIDLAVHSHKDLETVPPSGLKIACVSERANPADILLILKEAIDENQKWSLKKNATIGTSSARRKSQVLKYRPDTKINDLRGNVPTRIDKLRRGNYDAIILAKAGVDRLELDLSEFLEVILNPTEFVPAPAQGVLGVQIRNEDDELNDILQKINFPEVQKRIKLERKVLNLLDGGCQLPLGVYCDVAHNLYVSFADGIKGECTLLKYKIEVFEGMAEKVISDLKK
jgi:hydroxymethylbilane synthase